MATFRRKKLGKRKKKKDFWRGGKTERVWRKNSRPEKVKRVGVGRPNRERSQKSGWVGSKKTRNTRKVFSNKKNYFIEYPSKEGYLGKRLTPSTILT